MSHLTIDTQDFEYVISPDLELPIAQRVWAVVIAQLTDELSGTTPDGWLRLNCDNKNFTPRIGSGGFAGVAAIPARSMPLLATQSYSMVLTLSSNDYVSDTRKVTVPANPAFPAAFSPLNLGTWPLHRNPLSLSGTVTLATAAGAVPVVGASVSVTQLWRKVGAAPVAVEPLTLRTVLAAARPAGASVQHAIMTPAGPPYQLVTAIDRSASTVLLSNTVGLAVGDTLGFDLGDPDLLEYATVASIAGSVTPLQPATVSLTLPLVLSHVALGAVQRVTVALAGAVNTLSLDAIVGDRVLMIVAPIAGVATGNVVEISGGIAGPEYKTAALFTVTTDALGNYRLPLLSRVAQLELTANDGVHLPVKQLVVPPYGNGDYRVDLLLQ